MRWLAGVGLFAWVALVQAQETGVAARATEILKEPSVDAAVVGRLAEAAQVKILARQGGWMQVESSIGSGWVRLLAIRTAAGSAPTSPSRGGGFFSFLSRPSSGGGGQTVTTGVRGLDREQIQNAKPNLAELQKMAGFAASKADAERFGASAGVTRQQVGYLKPPAAPAAPITPN
jgi:hypothetical protein